MKRVSRKHIIEVADINATRDIPVTYFPFPEYTERVAYSAGMHGWTGNLFKGLESGVLYAVTDGANEGAGIHRVAESFGFREREIVRNLSHVELVESDSRGGISNYCVMAFVSCDGSRFTVATFDHGKNWEVCG